MKDMHNDNDPQFRRDVTMYRQLACFWIARDREARRTQLHIGAAQYTNDPLPRAFPFGHFTMTETIRWQDGVHRHNHQATLVFRGLPNVTNGTGWAPFVWQLYSGEVILGHVELDARLFFDPEPLLSWDADFVLESMMQSLSQGRQLRVSSRIEEGFPRNVQVFEIRTFDNGLLRELGRRYIHKRVCSICHRALPPTGPQQCLYH
ncbi:hypothetical protein CCMSSC00406_0007471 [Pleurotus cornucopiae]|uniref:Uncharacterized protein n=1 Tax=Pleurotus cornucopiae TaxID=5321 RepID=A0ACB7J701_PLECO|nr:hypothetical protein CCMSSC00406_0007471 [Pleurotus cornucopiae]